MPLLVVGTTRPELLERRPDFPGATGRTVRIELQPLPADAATDLLRDLLDGAVDRADGSSTPILERAAGNPLFAEEFVRLLRDRDLLVTADGVTDLRDGARAPGPGHRSRRSSPPASTRSRRRRRRSSAMPR